MKTTQVNQILMYPISIVILAFVLHLNSFAQNAFTQTGNSSITVAGTSTLHEWTMTSKDGKYQADFEVSADGAPTHLKAITVTIPSESLKSGHGGMDKNAYSSLKTGKHKSITFSLITARLQNNKIQCNGNLTICGVAKPISLEVDYKVNPDHSLICIGSKAFKMSEYEVEPPSFMFGTVKTGDEITVSFNLELAVKK